MGHWNCSLSLRTALRARTCVNALKRISFNWRWSWSSSHSRWNWTADAPRRKEQDHDYSPQHKQPHAPHVNKARRSTTLVFHRFRGSRAPSLISWLATVWHDGGYARPRSAVGSFDQRKVVSLHHRDDAHRTLL